MVDDRILSEAESRSRSKNKEKKDKDKKKKKKHDDRDRDRDRRSKDKGRDKQRDHDRDRSKSPKKKKNHDKDIDSTNKIKQRDVLKQREQQRQRQKQMDKWSRDRDRDREKDRKDKQRQKDKNKQRGKEKDRQRQRDRGDKQLTHQKQQKKDKQRDMQKSKQKSRDREKDKKQKNKQKQKHRQKQRDRQSSKDRQKDKSKRNQVAGAFQNEPFGGQQKIQIIDQESKSVKKKKRKSHSRSAQKKKSKKQRQRSYSRDKRDRSREKKRDKDHFRKRPGFDKYKSKKQSSSSSDSNDNMSDDPEQVQKLAQMKAAKQLVSSKADRKLYLGNLPPNITSQQLMDMLNGALKKMQINTEQEGDSIVSAWISPDGVGHYAFVEFRSAQQATNGLTLNGASLFGYQLKLGRPKQYIEYNKTLLSQMGTDRNMDTILKKVAALGSTNIPPIEERIVCPPSKIVVLKYIVSIEQLAIDEEYEEILQDVREMAKRFGEVVNIIIPRPHQIINLEEAPKRVKGLGLIFIEYKQLGQAIYARTQFVAKEFSGQPVACGFFSESQFREQDYDIQDKVIINF